MTTVSLSEAKERLPELFDAAERGEEVVFEHDGRRWALVETNESEQPPSKRRRNISWGLYKGQAIINDPNWLEPLDDEGMKELFGDAYDGA